jgi:hypothetical protein
MEAAKGKDHGTAYDDILEFASDKVKEYLKEHGQFDYELVKGDHLESRGIKVVDEYEYKYKGQWNISTNKREGAGIIVYTDGGIYQGYWKNDNRH